MADKLNVLFLQSQSGFGADAAIHADLMRYLDRDEFVVHMACTAGDGDEKPASLSRFEQIPDVRLQAIRFAPGRPRSGGRALLRSMRTAAGSPLDFAALCGYVKRERVDIVHAADRPRDSTYAVTLAKLTRAKSVVHVHVKWSDEYSAPAKWSVRHADGAFAISSYVAGTIVQMGKPERHVYTIPNAIDPSRWDPTTDGRGVRRELGIADATPLLASVSRLFSWKGQRELVRALALVKTEVPTVRLVIVGADETNVQKGSFTEELKALSRELGVADSVTFTGQRSDVPAIMAACDVFTLPSFEEPFGLVFLEAMAMRKPVVAVNNGGTPEVVEDGQSGLLSPPWDVPALAANIVRLLKDGALRARLGEHGRTRVLDYFNPRRMAADAARAYRAILETHS
jgi:glycosyltransferase involved in cell wall biosynthesis